MSDQGFRRLVVPPELSPVMCRVLRRIDCVPVRLPEDMTGEDDLPTFVIHPAPAVHTGSGA